MYCISEGLGEVKSEKRMSVGRDKFSLGICLYICMLF